MTFNQTPSLMLTLSERLFYAFWGKNTEIGRENLRILDIDWVTRTNYRMKGIKRNESDPNHVRSALFMSTRHHAFDAFTLDTTQLALYSRQCENYTCPGPLPSYRWQKMGPPARSACMHVRLSPGPSGQGKRRCIYLSLCSLNIQY
jgi:hypothetical protein